MSDVPHIFDMPSNRWSDRTNSPDGDAAAGPDEPRDRRWVFAATGIAWGIVGFIVTLVWLALS